MPNRNIFLQVYETIAYWLDIVGWRRMWEGLTSGAQSYSTGVQPTDELWISDKTQHLFIFGKVPSRSLTHTHTHTSALTRAFFWEAEQ